MAGYGLVKEVEMNAQQKQHDAVTHTLGQQLDILHARIREMAQNDDWPTIGSLNHVSSILQEALSFVTNSEAETFEEWKHETKSND